VTPPHGDAPVDTTAGRDIAAIEQQATRIARAVTRCPDVVRLSPGPAATYLPHRTIPGVVLTEGATRVAVVARYGRPLPEVADEVRAAVRQAVPGLRVDVLIEDVDVDLGAPEDVGAPDGGPQDTSEISNTSGEGAMQHG
jgi:hypothetical protein